MSMARHLRSRPRPTRDERGSLTVELVVLLPVLAAFLLAVVAAGRIEHARELVAGAARAGAEIASVQATAPEAEADARSAASLGLIGPAQLCPAGSVDTGTGQFFPGGTVTVKVRCRVPLSGFVLPGLPGTTVVRAVAVAPIDPYRAMP
ncbi:MAG: TadE/TadG family type IV pilus assembly protein [Acidimicrobiales bacterium]|jgi:Flp pilus assembly protein TadG